MPLNPNELSRWESDKMLLPKIGKEIEERFFRTNPFLKLAGRAPDRCVRTHQIDGVGEFRIRMKDNLRGDGVTGNTNFAENRDNLEYYTNSFYSAPFGNSIESEDNAYERAKGVDFIATATNSLINWANRKIHSAFCMTLINNPTNILVCDSKESGFKTKTNADKEPKELCKKIAAGDVVSVKAIRQLVRMAKTGITWDGSVGFIVPPLRVSAVTNSGIEYEDEVYLIMLSTTQCYQLKADPEWKEIQKYASVRGETNALFTGAIGSIDGAIIVDAKDYVNGDIIGLPSTKTAQKDFNKGVQGDSPMTLSDYKDKQDVSFGALLGAGALVYGANDTTKILIEKSNLGTKMIVGLQKFLGLGKARYQKRSINGNYIDATDPLHNKDYGVIVIASSNE